MTALLVAAAVTFGLALGYSLGSWHMRRVYAELIERLARNWGEVMREGGVQLRVVDPDDGGTDHGAS